MNVLELLKSIDSIIEQKRNGFTPHEMEINDFFLHELRRLVDQQDIDPILNATRTSILLEGFYRYLPESNFKVMMAQIRIQRWGDHFGTPTISFLLSYKHQIDDTQKIFSSFTKTEPIELFPWIVNEDRNSVVDHCNYVIADPKSIARVEAPSQREVTGVFTKTHNPFGGFTTTPCDPISQQFIEHAAEAAIHGGKVLEIGAAFGAATLAAIAKGATVYCNDIDVSNCKLKIC